MIIQECATASGWQEVSVESSSEPDTSYVVSFAPWDRSESEAICECPGYAFRGYCRHQREALATICQWSELDSMAQTPEQKNEHTCPECGGPTRTVVINGD